MYYVAPLLLACGSRFYQKKYVTFSPSVILKKTTLVSEFVQICTKDVFTSFKRIKIYTLISHSKEQKCIALKSQLKNDALPSPRRFNFDQVLWKIGYTRQNKRETLVKFTHRQMFVHKDSNILLKHYVIKTFNTRTNVRTI